MDSNDRVDLSSVNKTKKQFKLPKLRNPFKKQKGLVRDDEGKFTSGSGGIFPPKHFNFKRALPLIAVVALVGGYFVFQSFADTKSPSYQYSVFSCGAVDKSKNPNYSCQDYSAESLVYRTYKAVLNREPLKTDYKSWVQPMVGGAESLSGRMQPDTLIKRVLASSEAKSKKGLLFDGAFNRGSIVAKLYQNTLGRVPSSSESAYWQKEISAKKMSNERFVEVFITQAGPRDRQRTGFLRALSSQKVEKFKIDPIAKRKQDKRAQDVTTINARSVAIIKEMQKRSTDNNNRKISAGNLASQPGSKISKDTISTIRNNNYNVIKARLDGFKGKDYKGKIVANLATVKNINGEAVAITRQSPDLTNARSADGLKKAQSYVSEADRHIANANWLLGETGKALGTAERKYNEHQAWLRLQQEIANCKNSGKLWQNGKCVPRPQPVPDPANPGSGDGGTAGSNCLSGYTLRNTPKGKVCLYLSEMTKPQCTYGDSKLLADRLTCRTSKGTMVGATCTKSPQVLMAGVSGDMLGYCYWYKNPR